MWLALLESGYMYALREEIKEEWRPGDKGDRVFDREGIPTRNHRTRLRSNRI